jgi:hypothetical protein
MSGGVGGEDERSSPYPDSRHWTVHARRGHGEKVTFRSEAWKKILRGATLIADALGVTLGPKSKCVLIENA